jgi:hypothetical protein
MSYFILQYFSLSEDEPYHKPDVNVRLQHGYRSEWSEDLNAPKASVPILNLHHDSEDEWQRHV